MRIVSFLLIVLSLASCNRSGSSSKDAIRQGVLDYLSGRKDLNIAQMDVDVTSVQFDGSKADAIVSFSPKGSNAAGMTMHYTLEQQGSRWSVVGHQDSGHAAQGPPGGANPHGGGAVPEPPANPHGGGGGTKMPSPDDLPPAGGNK